MATDSNPAMGAAFDEYSARAVRFAASMLGCWADAEEVVQEAFCRMLVSRHADRNENFAAVLFATIRHLCIDHIRRRQSRRTVTLGEHGNAIADATLVGVGEENELRDAIRAEMEQLPDNWRDALRLRVDGQLTYEEIAAVLDGSRSQVRTWIYRARRQLETRLANLLDESANTRTST